MTDNIKTFDGETSEVDEVEIDPIPTFEKAPAKKPEYFVAGQTFFVETELLKFEVPLKLSVRDLRKLRDTVKDEHDELDQIVILLELLGDEKTLDVLMDADALDATFAAQKFFQAWEERSRTRLGK